MGWPKKPSGQRWCIGLELSGVALCVLGFVALFVLDSSLGLGVLAAGIAVFLAAPEIAARGE